jgi:predicted GIY-YIG superfamily endonuclease
MTCCVYTITHRQSGRCYVGSSKHVERRFYTHRRTLDAGSHHSAKLQRAWRKYGAEAFEFAILLTCESNERIAQEQRYIDEFCAFERGYNMLPKAGSIVGVKQTAAWRANLKAASRARAKKHQWKGGEYCLSEIAEMEGMDFRLLDRRVNTCGWTIEKAVTVPRPERLPLYPGFGKAQTIYQWAAEFGRSPSFYRSRLANGLTIEDCVADLKTWTASEFGRSLGVDANVFNGRMRKGWSLGDAVAIPVRRNKPTAAGVAP